MEPRQHEHKNSCMQCGIFVNGTGNSYATCTRCMDSRFPRAMPRLSQFPRAMPRLSANWIMTMASFYRHFAQQQQQRNFPLLPYPLPGSTALYTQSTPPPRNMRAVQTPLAQNNIVLERNTGIAETRVPAIDSRHIDRSSAKASVCGESGVASSKQADLRGESEVVPLSEQLSTDGKNQSTHPCEQPGMHDNSDVTSTDEPSMQNYLARQPSVLQSMWDKKLASFRCQLYHKLFKGSPHHPHGSLISTWRWKVKLEKSILKQNLMDMEVDTR